jgi:hypothetical protein
MILTLSFSFPLVDTNKFKNWFLGNVKAPGALTLPKIQLLILFVSINPFASKVKFLIAKQ